MDMTKERNKNQKETALLSYLDALAMYWYMQVLAGGQH